MRWQAAQHILCCNLINQLDELVEIVTEPVVLGIQVDLAGAIPTSPLKSLTLTALPSVSSRFMLCDKILDVVCECQKDETVIRAVESSLALVEDMYCRIDAPISRRLLVSHLNGIDCLWEAHIAPHGLVYYFEGVSIEGKRVELSEEAVVQ